MTKLKLASHHEKVLQALDELTEPSGDYCVGFSPLVLDCGMDRQAIRRVVRHFARKGWAEYYKGLLTEDGDLAGSGYCITHEGRAALSRARGDAQ